MDRAHLTKEVQEAERELDAAKGRAAINAAAKRLQRARAEMKQLDAEQSKRSASRRGRWSAASFS